MELGLNVRYFANCARRSDTVEVVPSKNFFEPEVQAELKAVTIRFPGPPACSVRQWDRRRGVRLPKKLRAAVVDVASLAARPVAIIAARAAVCSMYTRQGSDKALMSAVPAEHNVQCGYGSRSELFRFRLPRTISLLYHAPTSAPTLNINPLFYLNPNPNAIPKIITTSTSTHRPLP